LYGGQNRRPRVRYGAWAILPTWHSTQKRELDPRVLINAITISQATTRGGHRTAIEQQNKLL
jgi:hypothetical protein